MKSSRPSRPDFGTEPLRRGFTLVELLVVLAIIAILAVLSLPAVKGVLGSMDMKGAANLVAAQFDLARQTASTRNVQVDVRIYQDPTVPDANAATTYSYRIISVVIPGVPNGLTTGDEFLSPGIGLPGDIVFDQSTVYSTLLDPGQVDGSGIAGNFRGYNYSPTQFYTEPTTAPSLVQGKKYMKVTFLPNGSVYLNNTQATSGFWCLSLRNLHAPAAKSLIAPSQSIPAQNYICLVLDPSTSRARVYQP